MLEKIKMLSSKIPILRVIGGIGTIVGAILGISSLYNWYNQKTIEDISGIWKVSYAIDETTYVPYKGLQIGYTIFIQQEGTNLKGIGEKISENGQVLPASAKTPIKVNGTFDGENVLLTVEEKGKKRESSGMIKLKVLGNHDSVFEGTFSTTAANSSGKCMVELQK